MNFVADPVSGWVLFTLSGICMASNAFLTVNVRFAGPKVATDDEHNMVLPEWVAERAAMKSKLAWLLVVGYPVFPALYILAFCHVISVDGLSIGYMVAGFLIKFIFVSTISFEATMLQVAAERRIAESKRQLLRYLFHEVRVPLNGLTMGISVMRNDNVRNVDVLKMMEVSADSMTAALNDVLSMSHDEDCGAMRLDMRMISVRSLVEAAARAVKPHAGLRGVSVVIEGLPPQHPQEVDPDAPPCNGEAHFLIRGDAVRLERVLVHFLTNAINHTTPPSRPEDDPAVVRVVVDLPPAGISAASLSNGALSASASGNNGSFTSAKFVQSLLPARTGTGAPVVTIMVSDNNRHHEGRERDEEEQLGLVVSDQIVKLHGGDLIVKVARGGPTVFGMQLPLAAEAVLPFRPRQSSSLKMGRHNNKAKLWTSMRGSGFGLSLEDLEEGQEGGDDDDDEEAACGGGGGYRGEVRALLRMPPRGGSVDDGDRHDHIDVSGHAGTVASAVAHRDATATGDTAVVASAVRGSDSVKCRQRVQQESPSIVPREPCRRDFDASPSLKV